MNEQVKQELADLLQVTPQDLQDETILAELPAWDSVTLLSVMVILGDATGREVTPGELLALRTFGDIAALYIAKTNAEARRAARVPSRRGDDKVTMPTTTIRAIAHAVPERVLGYDELVARFGERTVASIYKMSGIRERRVVAAGQCASDLAVAAARRLLAHTGVAATSIDALLFVSQTPDYRLPATASILQAQLGLPEHCLAFDMLQTCPSFIYGLAVAHSLLVAGTAERALVLNADALSTLIHPLDRGLVTLHGDAAAATLVERQDAAEGGIEFFAAGSAGEHYDRLIVPAGGARRPAGSESRLETTDETGCTRTAEQLFMDGPAVFHFVVYKVKDFLQQLLAERGLAVADYDMVLFHQANKTMVDLLYRGLGVPPEKRFYYLETVGNTSGASLPSLLAEAWRQGAIRPTSRTLLCSFGGGFSWGAFSVRWPAHADAAVPGAVDVPASACGATPAPAAASVSAAGAHAATGDRDGSL